MMSLLSERVIPLADVPGCLPLPTSYHCVYRWYRTGIRGTKLRTVMVGGRRCTSREEVERFLRATNAPRDPAAVVKTSTVRQAQVDLAGRQLAERGI